MSRRSSTSRVRVTCSRDECEHEFPVEVVFHPGCKASRYAWDGPSPEEPDELEVLLPDACPKCGHTWTPAEHDLLCEFAEEAWREQD